MRQESSRFESLKSSQIESANKFAVGWEKKKFIGTMNHNLRLGKSKWSSLQPAASYLKFVAGDVIVATIQLTRRRRAWLPAEATRKIFPEDTVVHVSITSPRCYLFSFFNSLVLEIKILFGNPFQKFWEKPESMPLVGWRPHSSWFKTLFSRSLKRSLSLRFVQILRHTLRL